MKFEIKCSTFVRLASVCSFFDPAVKLEDRAKVNTVRLEKVKGKTIAISTNRYIMAVELLPHFDPSPDGVCHVVLDPTLIGQCKFDSLLDATLTINTIPEIALGQASTSTGWSFGGNACHWFDETPLDRWREIAEKNVGKSQYVMSWNLPHVQSLFESSPTGKIYFPRHIDATRPITLRDMGDESWVGIFIPSIDSKDRITEAELPDWWNL